MGYNHFQSIKDPKGYTRFLFYCNTCKTPVFVNRESDLPKFCPVCHTIASWKSADSEYKKNWGYILEFE